MKVLTVVGTRPEIIRLSRVLAQTGRALRPRPGAYRTELRLRAQPDLLRRFGHPQAGPFLNAAGATGAETIGKVIIAVDGSWPTVQPDAMLVLGDTNSCMAVIPGQAPQDSRPSTWRPATAASTCACRKRSTGASSTIPPTSI
jgi:UDP-N-acetylglucosamine 2-epimerase